MGALNVYGKNERRLTQIIQADTQKKGQGAPFRDAEFWQFAKSRRME